MEQITYIITFVLKAFIHVWPYLLITIPLAVWMNLSDYSRYFKTLLSKSPWLSVILATIVGAFSPFCSCGVVPVISALLMGGVPLAPVFAFWVASPSMDPEIFFLSVSVLGWKLAVWRLAGTFLLSLGAGFFTHYLVKSGFITSFLKTGKPTETGFSFRNAFNSTKTFLAKKSLLFSQPAVAPVFDRETQFSGVVYKEFEETRVACNSKKSCSCSGEKKPDKPVSYRNKVIQESGKSVWMITKFMGLAFLLNALINLYVPEEWIGNLLNRQGFASVVFAAVLGVPVYTSNLSALPLVGGLMQLGLHPGAALAFLISGPLTTIPAMVAVYGITTRKVFGLYLFVALFGSLFFGILYYFLA